MRLKKGVICLALAVLLTGLGGCASSSQNTQKKDTNQGRKMTIVSTSVSICEILDRLGVDNVIDVPESSGGLPDRYKDVKTVGAPMNPDLEIVKSLDPDLVLSPQTLESEVKRTVVAQHIAVVHQSNTAPGDMTVEQLVSVGRTPCRSLFRSSKAVFLKICRELGQ